jgi:glycolate oxidase iron-sulfur subunit
MLALVPKRLPKPDTIAPGVYAAQGKQRGRVALLAGCAQQVLAPEINRSALNVLTRNGIEVTVPANQVCCGALAWHVGQGGIAKENVEANLRAFQGDFDAIITTAAGCGSALHEYPLIVRGDSCEANAKDFAHKAKDILTYLDKIGIEPPPALRRPVKVAYHDACHLAHAQRETSAPRKLLRLIQGVELVPLHDSDLCCGSAGSYNVDQPAIANQLGERKAKSILDSRCDVVALANIGCQIQVVKSLEQLGQPLPVLHVVRMLDLAYQGKSLT